MVLDTNALLLPFEYGLNLDIELERILGTPDIFVPSCVAGELARLSKTQREAKAALQLMEKYRIVEVEALGDNGVIEAGEKLGAYVLTNDRELIGRLRERKLGVITLKSNHLVILNETRHD